MLIFTNARIISLQCLRHHMVHYEESSGQKINLEKSVFHPSKLISSSMLVWIKQILGCLRKNLPFKYLGALIYKGRCQKHLFRDIMDKFARKLEGWHSRFFPLGAK